MEQCLEMEFFPKENKYWKLFCFLSLLRLLPYKISGCRPQEIRVRGKGRKWLCHKHTSTVKWGGTEWGSQDQTVAKHLWMGGGVFCLVSKTIRKYVQLYGEGKVHGRLKYNADRNASVFRWQSQTGSVRCDCTSVGVSPHDHQTWYLCISVLCTAKAGERLRSVPQHTWIGSSFYTVKATVFKSLLQCHPICLFTKSCFSQCDCRGIWFFSPFLFLFWETLYQPSLAFLCQQETAMNISEMFCVV